MGTSTSKIAGELQDPDEIETDVCEALELQDGGSDRIDQIKQFILHQTKCVKPRPKAEPLLRV